MIDSHATQSVRPRPFISGHAGPAQAESADSVNRLEAQALWLRDASVGHPGPGGSRLAGATPVLAAMVAALFSGHLRQDPGTPEWPNRDRCEFAHGRAEGLLRLLAAHGIHRSPPPPARHRMRQVRGGPAGAASAVRRALANADAVRAIGEGLGAQAAALADCRTFLIVDASGIAWVRDTEALVRAGARRLSNLIVLVDETGAVPGLAHDRGLVLLAGAGWQIHEHAASDGIIELGRVLAMARHAATGPTLIRCHPATTTDDAGALLRAFAGPDRASPAEVARFWRLDMLGQRRIKRWRAAVERLRAERPSQAEALMQGLARLDAPERFGSGNLGAPRVVRAARLRSLV
ncbi:MAG: hypothetical protein R3E87_04035 [Burkholderiaceae bacterium]